MRRDVIQVAACNRINLLITTPLRDSLKGDKCPKAINLHATLN